MKQPRLAAAAIALTLLTSGCAGGIAPQPGLPQARTAAVAARAQAESADPAAAPKTLYVSNGDENAIDIFDLASGKETGSIAAPGDGSQFFEGISTGPQSAIYATWYDTEDNLSAVLVYPPGYSYPAHQLADNALEILVDAVNPAGEVAMGNADDPPSPGDVEFVEPGKSAPSRTISAFAGGAFTVAYDANGYLWAAGSDAHGKYLVEYVPPRATAGVKVPIRLRTSAIAADASGNMLFFSGTKYVEAFNTKGQHVYTVPIDGATAPIDLKLTTGGSVLYVLDRGGNVYAYPFPGGGKPARTIAVGGAPIGFAFTAR